MLTYEELNEKQRKRKKAIPISFRVSEDTYNLLKTFASEQKDMKISDVVRKLINKALFSSDEKTIKQGLLNLHNASNRINEKLDLLILIFENYLLSHFSLHPEIPIKYSDTVLKFANARRDTFFKELMKEDIISGGLIIEKIIANYMEERK